MQKALIILGLVLIFTGLAWPWLKTVPLGHLPGDIVIEKESYRVYFPITTMVIVSVLASAILWFFRRY